MPHVLSFFLPFFAACGFIFNRDCIQGSSLVFALALNAVLNGAGVNRLRDAYITSSKKVSIGARSLFSKK